LGPYNNCCWHARTPIIFISYPTYKPYV
jgi:hypothetical protein